MNLIKSGVILILIGLAMVIIGGIISSQKTDIGGLIMIGPIPIAFGTSPEITIIAMVIGLILMLLMFFLGRNKAQEEISYLAKDTDEGLEGKIKGGGVIFIGPIPIVLGTDKCFAIIAIVMTIALLLLAMIFFKLIKCC